MRDGWAVSEGIEKMKTLTETSERFGVTARFDRLAMMLRLTAVVSFVADSDRRWVGPASAALVADKLEAIASEIRETLKVSV